MRTLMAGWACAAAIGVGRNVGDTDWPAVGLWLLVLGSIGWLCFLMDSEPQR